MAKPGAETTTKKTLKQLPKFQESPCYARTILEFFLFDPFHRQILDKRL